MYQETAKKPKPPSVENIPEQSSESAINTSELEQQPSSPFQRGLMWGAIFTVTAAMSAAVGAAVTLVSPLDLTPAIAKAQSWLPSIGAKSEATAKIVLPNQFPAPPPPQKTRLKVNDSPYNLSRPLNLLVMGIDGVANAQLGSPEAFSGRSDSLMLIRFEPGNNSVRLLSIPRDSRVEVPQMGSLKIEQINANGGAAMTARVVSKTLNDVPIDRYIRITTKGLQELVNLVGGVEIFVPHPMSYTDVSQNLLIDLEAGWQTLNGQEAEQFVRFQEEEYGDLGRLQRQQLFLEALQNSLHNRAIFKKIPQLISLLQQYVDTNLTLEEMLALAYFNYQVDPQDWQMVILPGEFSEEEDSGKAREWLIDHRGRDRLLSQYFSLNLDNDTLTENPLASRQDISIAIQNATSDPGLGPRLASYLAKEDFVNVYVSENAPQLLHQTEIIVQQGDLQSADLVQKILGLGRLKPTSTGDLASELTIRVGEDAKELLTEDSFLEIDSSNQ